MPFPKKSALPKVCFVAGALLAMSAVHAQELPKQEWRKKLEDQGITLGLNEQAEIWTNFAGGVRRGARFNGL